MGSTQIDIQPGHASDAASNSDFMRASCIYAICPHKTTYVNIPCDYELPPPSLSQWQVHSSEFGPMLRNGIIEDEHHTTRT